MSLGTCLRFPISFSKFIYYLIHCNLLSNPVDHFASNDEVLERADVEDIELKTGY